MTQSHSGGGGTWPTLLEGDGQPRFLAVILSTDPLPIDPGSWGYLATPVSQEHFDTLVAATDGSALVGIHRRRDRREEMVQTFDANADQAQAHLLRRGELEWVTRGTYLGHQRSYLWLQIDDVLLPNHGWDPDAHAIDRDLGATIRMTPEDATHAADWARARGLRLDLVTNGARERAPRACSRP